MQRIGTALNFVTLLFIHSFVKKKIYPSVLKILRGKFCGNSCIFVFIQKKYLILNNFMAFKKKLNFLEYYVKIQN